MVSTKIPALGSLDVIPARFLVTAIEKVDADGLPHSMAVADISHRLATLLGQSDYKPETMWLAGLMHDIGNLGIPRAILDKPAKLADDEFQAVKQHTALGNFIVANLYKSDELAAVAMHHHERYDGEGYPRGLKGNDIPFMARIVAMADAYDAIISTRSYFKGKSRKHARQQIKDGAGTQFDPDIAEVFLANEEEIHESCGQAKKVTLEELLTKI